MQIVNSLVSVWANLQHFNVQVSKSRVAEELNKAIRDGILIYTGKGGFDHLNKAHPAHPQFWTIERRLGI